MKENQRKCCKCGCSPAEDPNITLHRFPKPGRTNSLRCELWAKYCFPHESWWSPEVQNKLHSRHLMLCTKHFKRSSFIDNSGKKLVKSAAPDEECDKITSADPNLNQINLIQPTASPSVMLQSLCENIQNPIADPNVFEPIAGPSRMIQPISESVNINPYQASAILQISALDEECDKIASSYPNMNQINLIQPIASPSVILQPLCENIQNPIADPKVFEPVAGPSRMIQPISESLNINLHKESAISQITEVNPTANALVTTRKDKNMLMKMKNHMRKITRLQKSVKHLKNESFLKVLSKNDSIHQILKRKISPSFALLLQGELQNYKKRPKGRRWDMDSKIIALRMYKRSPRCYKLLRRVICLPTPSSLKTLLNKFYMSVGINGQIFNVLKKTIKEQDASENNYILMFDEMSIKKNLFYNQKEDLIEGYQDHAFQGRSPQIATHALVFMIGGIRKKLKQPIAYYFSSGSVTADRLSVLIKEVLQHCFDAGINIAASVCDMDRVNKRALNILGASAEHPYILFNNKEIVAIFDTPHLLKCFRNMFLKYNIKCPTNIISNEQIGFGIAKWSYIKEFYEADNSNPNFVYAPCLKQEHLNPNTKQKMKVKLAAQVFSHSVAGGMLAKISEGELSSDAATTANVILNMDKLFDSVNACTPDLRRGKQFSTNIKSNSPHFTHFKFMKYFFKNMTYLECRRPPPSQEGWIWSINGIERIWRNLSSNQAIKSLETRRLQQDPLENLFGCIRANCGCNTNPTAGQFVAGLKTAVLSNLSFIGTGNCEDDENDVILNNFKTLLSPPTDIHTTCATILNNEFEESINSTFESSLEESSGEIQACAYVCGFIIKKNPNTCEICNNIFVAETQERSHTFIEFKEYNDIKKSLKYASNKLIYCIESGATLINGFLDTQAYKKNLKRTVEVLFKSSINFDFLEKCPEHKDVNINYLFNSVFHICIKRFCVLKNRQFAEEYSASALKRKMDILQNK